MQFMVGNFELVHLDSFGFAISRLTGTYICSFCSQFFFKLVAHYMYYEISILVREKNAERENDVFKTFLIGSFIRRSDQCFRVSNLNQIWTSFYERLLYVHFWPVCLLQRCFRLTLKAILFLYHDAWKIKIFILTLKSNRISTSKQRQFTNVKSMSKCNVETTLLLTWL